MSFPLLALNIFLKIIVVFMTIYPSKFCLILLSRQFFSATMGISQRPLNISLNVEIGIKLILFLQLQLLIDYSCQVRVHIVFSVT